MKPKTQKLKSGRAVGSSAIVRQFAVQYQFPWQQRYEDGKQGTFDVAKARCFTKREAEGFIGNRDCMAIVPLPNEKGQR